ncbi:hypothetical protein BD413DRAFT_507714 [Trametes elegans]|nr:hypothetical protein BD413DRAFT_507714 [Trametes elegans]
MEGKMHMCSGLLSLIEHTGSTAFSRRQALPSRMALSSRFVLALLCKRPLAVWTFHRAFLIELVSHDCDRRHGATEHSSDHCPTVWLYVWTAVENSINHSVRRRHNLARKSAWNLIPEPTFEAALVEERDPARSPARDPAGSRVRSFHGHPPAAPTRKPAYAICGGRQACFKLDTSGLIRSGSV